VPVPLPDLDSRWRCARCGNLTRFEVQRSRRTLEYWHVDLAGEATVAETDLLEETVEHVRCRWCQAEDSVELVGRPRAGGSVPDGQPAGPAAPAGGVPGDSASS
jgi:hypothetical protein